MTQRPRGQTLRLGHPEAYPGPCYRSTALAAIRAAAAPVGGFPLLAIVVYVANKHPTIYAGAGTLQASVVRLYGVVVILGGWLRVGCARLSGVHRGSSLWAWSRGAPTPAGPLLYPIHIFYLYITLLQPFMVHFQEMVMRAKWIGDGYNASRGLYRRQAQSFTD